MRPGKEWDRHRDPGGEGIPPEGAPEGFLACLESASPRSSIVPVAWHEGLAAAEARWEKGAYANLLLLGNVGAGKTVLLDRIEAGFPRPVRVLDPSCREHPAESSFIAELSAMSDEELADSEPRMVIVDNLEMFFLRTPGSFGEIRSLMFLAERSKSRIIWIFACSVPLYQYLRLIYPMDLYFPFKIDLDNVEIDNLVDEYDAKLASAGFSYSIVPDKPARKQILAMKRRHAIGEKDVDRQLKLFYFRSLVERGGVNFPFINHYLARSLVGVDGRSLRFRTPKFFDTSFVEKFPLPALFSLQALYIHKSLDAGELARALAIRSDEARLSLGMLHESGLALVEGRRYRISPVIYRPVYELLRKKNLFP